MVKIELLTPPFSYFEEETFMSNTSYTVPITLCCVGETITLMKDSIMQQTDQHHTTNHGGTFLVIKVEIVNMSHRRVGPVGYC